MSASLSLSLLSSLRRRGSGYRSLRSFLSCASPLRTYSIFSIPSISLSSRFGACWIRGGVHPSLVARRLYSGGSHGSVNSSSGQTPPPSSPLVPPIAPVEPKTLPHGRVDDYYYMCNRDDPRVLDYIRAENAYTENVTRGQRVLEEKLFEEFRSRIKETDESVPVRHGSFMYYTRTVEGKQYRIYCRRRLLENGIQGPEEILLDVNEAAANHDFYSLGAFSVSPDHKLLAFSVDTTGREVYTMYVKNLETGEMLKDVIEGVYDSAEWSTSSSHLFYVTLDDALRPFKVWRHEMGSSSDKDVCIFSEPDERFFVGINKTSSERFLLIELGSKTQNEIHYLDASTPLADWICFQPRMHDLEYDIDHSESENCFYVVSNLGGRVNFALMKTPVTSTGASSWKEVVPYWPERFVASVKTFRDFVVMGVREDGVKKYFIHRIGSQSSTTSLLKSQSVSVRVTPEEFGYNPLRLPENAYSLSLSENPEYDSETLRISYSSMVTPRSVYDVDMNTLELSLMKQDEVLGGYNASSYHTERLFVTARDGTRVPLSIVYRRDLFRADGSNPCVLYGYGSYGMPMDPAFNSTRLSLLDRGFVYVIAHIRGGGENGRPWYLDGKLNNKKNTFHDFIDCAEYLIEHKLTSSDRLVCRGGSAGGLLIGAVINERPDLFRIASALVPFVDVVTTMLDPSIPLTVTEYEEWGNPEDFGVYAYMTSYSPYDNVSKKEYPSIFVESGLNDPRVQYHEPTKWVAKLRRENLNPSSKIILRTNMGAGHGGASGRYDYLKEIAFEYAFFIHELGIE